MPQGLQQIELGDVFHLRCTLCNPPKPKFFVVAQVEPLRMFLINSKLTHFVASSPHRTAAHARIFAAEHVGFLKHDSYVACDAVSHEYSLEQLQQLMANDSSIHRGTLSIQARSAVAIALANCRTMARKYLNELRPFWPIGTSDVGTPSISQAPVLTK